MAQDLRDLMKGQNQKGSALPEGHEGRFAAKLEEAFGENKTPDKKSNTPSFFWLKIAAAIVAFVAVGFWFVNLDSGNNSVEDALVDQTEVKLPTSPQLTMGDISPDLKKIEDFYLAGINVQLASLKNENDNKELIDGYMKRLEELNREYKRLTNELNRPAAGGWRHA